MADQPIAYDPGVIREFAGRLYRQARSVIVTSTLLGVLGGGILGALTANLAGFRGDMRSFALLGIVVGGVWGFLRGRERAFKLKLEAQIALCQVQIEKNTLLKTASHCFRGYYAPSFADHRTDGRIEAVQ